VAQPKSISQHSALEAPLDTTHPDQILTFHEWCRLNRFSVRTGRRIVAAGDGPTVTRLSPRRIGVSIANNARWQASRASGPPPEAFRSPHHLGTFEGPSSAVMRGGPF